MSINYNGKCEHCGKGNQRVTLDVHIHDIPGTRGCEHWCWSVCEVSVKKKPHEKDPANNSELGW